MLVFVVVECVEVLEEELTEDEVLVVEFVQFVFSDGELALGVLAIHLEEILGRHYLEDGLTPRG